MLRFRRSIKLFPGVRINIGKRGVSTTIGRRGASINIGKRGTYLNTGIPGTGISSRTKLERVESDAPAPPESQTSNPAPVRKPLRLLPTLLIGTIVVAMFQSTTLIYLFWGLMAFLVIMRLSSKRKSVPNFKAEGTSPLQG